LTPPIGVEWPQSCGPYKASSYDSCFIEGERPGNCRGCGLGQCGACTVLVDNRAMRSCVLPVSSALGKEIVTLEGLGTLEKPHPIQTAFIEEQTFQCGYCLNGWVLTAKALLDKNPHPTDAEMRAAFESLVCRCGSHVRIFSAVRRAAEMMKRSA
jgi:nicotinate dehydrogenase subunit A